MEFLELINFEKLRRAILYFVLLAATLILQNTVLCRVTILGVKPMIVPAAVAAIGLFEDGQWGGIFGIVAGVYCDLSSIGSTAMFTVCFAVIGFLSGLLSDLYINRRFYSYMILALISFLFLGLCQIVPLWIYRGAGLGALVKTALLQSIWSLPFAALEYPLCRMISRLDLHSA